MPTSTVAPDSMCDAFRACHQCLTATVFACDWCHNGGGGGVCRNATGTPCDAPFGDKMTQVAGCDAIRGTTTDSNLPDGSAENSLGETITIDSNATGDEQGIDPSLLWGLVAGGICCFLLLVLLLCIALTVRKRRQRDDEAETSLSDLHDSGVGKYLYDEPADPSPPTVAASPSAPSQTIIYDSVKSLERPPEQIVYSSLQ